MIFENLASVFLKKAEKMFNMLIIYVFFVLNANVSRVNHRCLVIFELLISLNLDYLLTNELRCFFTYFNKISFNGLS